MTRRYSVESSPVGDVLLKSTKKALLKRGFGDAQLLMNWQNIMNSLQMSSSGVALVKIARVGPKGCVLYISSSDLGFRSTLAYQKASLIERANKLLEPSRQIFDVKLI